VNLQPASAAKQKRAKLVCQSPTGNVLLSNRLAMKYSWLASTRLEFGRLGRRVIEGRFDGGNMTSDGGGCALPPNHRWRTVARQ
jgi:hypothetical protein